MQRGTSNTYYCNVKRGMKQVIPRLQRERGEVNSPRVPSTLDPEALFTRFLPQPLGLGTCPLSPRAGSPIKLLLHTLEKMTSTCSQGGSLFHLSRFTFGSVTRSFTSVCRVYIKLIYFTYGISSYPHSLLHPLYTKVSKYVSCLAN